MVQRRQHFGFTLESGNPLRIAREAFGQNVQSYFAIEFRIGCPIDFAHPPAPSGAVMRYTPMDRLIICSSARGVGVR
jgi:hypothetical protein